MPRGYSDSDDADIHNGYEKSLVIRIKDTALAPLRVATSKSARRAYISTFLLISASFVLFGFAVAAYLLFYYSFIPQIGLERTVHLQFGDGNPHGVAALSSQLISEQRYDVSVSLHLPRTPSNLDAGNFMLDLSLLSRVPSVPSPTPSSLKNPVSIAAEAAKKLSSETNALIANDVVAHARRSAILTYTSPLVDTAKRVADMPWYLLGWHKESEMLEVPMMEGVQFARGWKNVPGSLRLELQSPNRLQVYSAKVKFTARFGGLRYIMYNYRLLSFFILTSTFWVVEVISTSIAWLILSTFFSPPTTSKTGTADRPIKQEPEDDYPLFKREDDETEEYEQERRGFGIRRGSTPRIKREDEEVEEGASSEFSLSDTSRVFPSFSSRQPPLKYVSSSPGRHDGERSTSGTRGQSNPSPKHASTGSTGGGGAGGLLSLFKRESQGATEPRVKQEKHSDDEGEYEDEEIERTTGIEPLREVLAGDGARSVSGRTDSGLGTSIDESISTGRRGGGFPYGSPAGRGDGSSPREARQGLQRRRSRGGSGPQGMSSRGEDDYYDDDGSGQRDTRR